MRQFAEGERIVRRRFYDAGIAGKQRRRHLLVKEIAGKVEGNDGCDNTQRLFFYQKNVLFLARLLLAGNHFSVKMLCFFGKSAKCDGNIPDFCPGFRNGLSGFLRKGLRQIFLVSFHQFQKMREKFDTLVNGDFDPFFLRFLRKSNGAFHITAICLRNGVNDLSGCGIGHFNDFFRSGICGKAAD